MSFLAVQYFSLILLLHDFRLFRTVRLSSPTLNYFIIVGAVLMYTSIFFYLLPTEDEAVVKARCVVREVNTDELQRVLFNVVAVTLGGILVVHYWLLPGFWCCLCEDVESVSNISQPST